MFHHGQGRTPGVVAFADQVRAAGHDVHVPDLFEGRTFDDLEAGVGYAQEIGFATVIDRGERAIADLPAAVVYAGFSLGVLPAQKLAQTRPGAAGALLISACLPASEFGGRWPQGVPLQVHGMDADAFFVDEGDLAAARDLVGQVEDADLFLYPGDQHLFADSSLSSYDAHATSVLVERATAFLDRTTRT